jgi:hypothetical protein
VELGTDYVGFYFHRYVRLRYCNTSSEIRYFAHTTEDAAYCGDRCSLQPTACEHFVLQLCIILPFFCVFIYILFYLLTQCHRSEQELTEWIRMEIVHEMQPMFIT